MLSTEPFEIPAYLSERARDLPKLPMAIAGADNQVALESARMVAESGLVDPILVGEVDGIKAIAKEIGWDLDGIRMGRCRRRKPSLRKSRRVSPP